jgi:hypothetical protein
MFGFVEHLLMMGCLRRKKRQLLEVGKSVHLG